MNACGHFKKMALTPPRGEAHKIRGKRTRIVQYKDTEHPLCMQNIYSACKYSRAKKFIKATVQKCSQSNENASVRRVAAFNRRDDPVAFCRPAPANDRGASPDRDSLSSSLGPGSRDDRPVDQSALHDGHP